MEKVKIHLGMIRHRNYPGVCTGNLNLELGLGRCTPLAEMVIAVAQRHSSNIQSLKDLGMSSMSCGKESMNEVRLMCLRKIYLKLGTHR